ncbi:MULTISPECIES: hypothetical protein [Streptomyces]|uniref:Gram-positive cocci surface proteins LPxTG domain-containing protein n=2 Tax=Streptomyces TaxID=1883 RepID=A0ABV9INR0_9ACTN
MTMRLCTTVSLCLAAAAAALLPAPAHAADASACAGQESGIFPLTTRLHGGPDTYQAGGGYGTWYLDLANTTRRTCTGVHPVVVLVDTAHALRPSQPHLDFYADGRPHPVHFESTDEDELVGAFTDGPAFPGFTVGPGKTLTVKLRLALTSDTTSDDITLNAAVVQRHGDDGDWIGQSNDYRFTVEPTAAATGTEESDTTDTAGTAEPTPEPSPAGTSGTTGPSGPSDAPSPTGSPQPTGAPSLADEAAELARSGLASTAGLLTVTACLLAAGAAILLARRRD